MARFISIRMLFYLFSFVFFGVYVRVFSSALSLLNFVHVLCIGYKLLIAFDLLLISVCMRQCRAKLCAKIHYDILFISFFLVSVPERVERDKRTGEKEAMECIVLFLL